MKIILISTTGTEQISIDSFPFTLGRLSLDVLIKDPQVKANLKHISKKHAQLTMENGNIFLHDSGSLNGTYINSQKLKENKVQLKPGDLLSLAQKLDYIVDSSISQECKNPRPIFLQDVNTKTSTEISSLPFYCTANCFQHDQFLGKRPDHETALCVISFFNNELHIAPLIHDCPICINGIKLSVGHTLLNIGNTLSFLNGNSYILTDSSFSGKGETHKPPIQTPSLNNMDADQTVYMEDATMFMSVFNSEDEKMTTGKTDTADDASQFTDQQNASWINNRLFIKAAVISLITIALSIGGIFYYRSTPSYKVTQAFKKEQFETSLKLSNAYLADKNDSKVEEIGTKSLIKLISLNFLDAAEKKELQQIQTFLSSLEGNVKNIQASAKIIKTFSFISRVNDFSSKNDVAQTIDDNNWKKDILEINKEWTSSSNQYQAVISEIRQTTPKLNPVLDSFFSKINDCREYEIYYINTIANLELKISSLLTRQDYNAARKQITEFSKSNPKLGNTEKWLADLNEYEQTAKKINKSDLFELESIGLHSKPQTLLFKKLTSELITANLPPEDIRQYLIVSKQHWTAGNLEKATAALKSIPENQHQEKINDKLAFFQSVQKHQAEIRQDKNTPACLPLAKLAMLVKDRQTLLFDQYQSHFDECSKEAERMIPVHKEQALDAYNQFLKNGGISGQMRMSADISPAFKNNATLLVTALSESKAAQEWADSFRIILNEQTISIFSEINKEHTTQTVRIKESSILSSIIKNRKLLLLEPKEVN